MYNYKNKNRDFLDLFIFYELFEKKNFYKKTISNMYYKLKDDNMM